MQKLKIFLRTCKKCKLLGETRFRKMVFCEKCRSHKMTEINKHEEIEDAINAWNKNYGNKTN